MILYSLWKDIGKVLLQTKIEESEDMMTNGTIPHDAIPVRVLSLIRKNVRV